ncbi:cholecystokinin receptor type A-like [Ostrea edulis]|uniref:cholecystokinin receptor type A-like n=1 Tax=Ostrea edulis TaxID=37623 RepID=UPI0024AEE6E1|nr:cholecystokinin receptor type A-like [Ostrea edulis]XP_055997020.1 cholecystokinin receptor type A-like [Ostrea edulis]
MEIGNTTNSSVVLWDEATVNKINDSVFDKIYLPSFIYTLILLVIGCLGNSVVFYIYFTRWRKTTSRVFILALAVFDLINNFITTPTELHSMLNWFQTTNGGLCKFSRFLTFMMNNCSSVTLLGIALDRYRSICRPFQTQMSAKNAKIIVVVGVLLAVVFAWPALVVYGIQSIKIPIAPKTYVRGNMCMIEDGFVDTDYPLAFVIVLLAGNLLIDIALIIAYSCIAIQVIRRGSSFLCQTSKDMRKDSQSYSQSNTEDVFLDDKNSGGNPSILKNFSKQHGSSQEKSDSEVEMMSLNSDIKRSIKKTDSNAGNKASEKRAKFKRQRSLSVQSEEARRSRMIKITLMLFLVTLLFMISFIPYCVIVIIRYVQPNYYPSLSNTGKVFYHFILRSYLLSMSLNPVIYSFMSEKFREECRKCIRKFVRLFKSRN